MRTIRFFLLLMFFAMAAAVIGDRPVAAPNAGVSLEVIRYDDLGTKIQALKGEVVVVDFWADYCFPCKSEFPKLVDLHQRFAVQGLAAISVSLDDATDDVARARVKRFLDSRKATFSNYLLAEKPEVWQAKLKIDGPPCVFVFNRKGQLLKKYHDDVDYREIEKIVKEALTQ